MSITNSIHEHILPEGPAFTPQEVSRLRRDTTGCAHVIHLNNAGAGLMPDGVTQAVVAHTQLEATIGGYEAAAAQAEAIRQFYMQAGRLINSKPSNIAFTASATDSYTRALSSIPFRAGDVILTDTDDFISNQIQFLSCQKRFGVKIVHIQNDLRGGVDLQDLDQKLWALQPRLLAITHIPTNSGLMQPVKAIGEIYGRYLQAHGDKTWYILDACQSAGQTRLDVELLKCDFLSVTNRKFLRGPRGTGFLYVSDRALQAGLEPLFIDMRGAEWVDKDTYRARAGAIRFEDWEFAYALVLGSAHAIEYCLALGEDRIERQVKWLAGQLRQALGSIGGVRVLDRGPELGGLVTFTVPALQPEGLLNVLRQHQVNVVASYRGFAVIDFDDKGVAWALRASPHYYNTPEELEALVNLVQDVVR